MYSRPIACTTSARRPPATSTTTEPAARRAGRKIQRAQQPRVLGDVGDDLLAVPGVVAQRDHVGAGGEQRARHVGGQAEAVRGVLGVHHREVDAQRLAQPGQRGGHRLAAGAPDHVADEQDAHSFVPCRRSRRARSPRRPAARRRGRPALRPVPARHRPRPAGSAPATPPASGRSSPRHIPPDSRADRTPAAAPAGSPAPATVAVRPQTCRSVPAPSRRPGAKAERSTGCRALVFPAARSDGRARAAPAATAGCRSPGPSARTPTPRRPAGGGTSRSTCSASAAPQRRIPRRRAPPASAGAAARLASIRSAGIVRSRHGRWRLILPEPACAGGRQIPRPRSRQSQLPGRCLLAPGMNCLTHRAAPPSQSRDAPGPAAISSARFASLPSRRPSFGSGTGAAIGRPGLRRLQRPRFTS